MPRARDLAAQAADMMTYAGQGGGLLVVLSFFFAAEYTEQAWETKRETAATLGQAARTIARNWEAVEDGNTGGLRIE